MILPSPLLRHTYKCCYTSPEASECSPHHGTCIIVFSAASKHMAMALERATMIRFEPAMRARGTNFDKTFARQP